MVQLAILANLSLVNESEILVHLLSYLLASCFALISLHLCRFHPFANTSQLLQMTGLFLEEYSLGGNVNSKHFYMLTDAISG